jgi:hypothetical protein
MGNSNNPPSFNQLYEHINRQATKSIPHINPISGKIIYYKGNKIKIESEAEAITPFQVLNKYIVTVVYTSKNGTDRSANLIRHDGKNPHFRWQHLSDEISFLSQLC